MESYNTLALLNFLLRRFSLHSISYSKTGLIVNSWPHVKVISILSVTGFLIFYNIYLHFTVTTMKNLSPSVVVVDTVAQILSYCEYVVDLYYVYRYRSELCVYYNNNEQMDLVIKMKYNRNIKLAVVVLLSTSLPSWVLASLGQYSIWVLLAGWLSPTTYAVSYFTFLIRMLTALDFISQTMHIRYRLESITEQIEEFAAFAEDSTNRIKPVRGKWGNKTEMRDKTKVYPVISKCRCEIAKTSSYYLLLIEQTKFLNRFFGVRVLVNCLYTLTEMITFVNFIARVISGAMDVLMKSFVYTAPNILRFINCVAVLASIVYYSEACYYSCGNIVDVIDKTLVNKRISDADQSSLLTLRKLVTSRPLKFTAAGFFNLDSTLLLSLASVVITYALILVQSTQ